MGYVRFVTLAALGSVIWIGALGILGPRGRPQLGVLAPPPRVRRLRGCGHRPDLAIVLLRGASPAPPHGCSHGPPARRGHPARCGAGEHGCRLALATLSLRPSDRPGHPAGPDRAAAGLLLGPHHDHPLAAGIRSARARRRTAQVLRGGAARRHRRGADDRAARRGARGGRQSGRPAPGLAGAPRFCLRRSWATRSSARSSAGSAPRARSPPGWRWGRWRWRWPTARPRRGATSRPAWSTACGWGSPRPAHWFPACRATAPRWPRRGWRRFTRTDANRLSRHAALPVIAGATLLKGVRLARRGLPPARSCLSLRGRGRRSPRRSPRAG